jgi:hypothetical protein
MKGRRAPIHFNFFEGWLSYPFFQSLVRGFWTPVFFEQKVPVDVQFVGNLKRIKKEIITWAHEKNIKEEQELRHIKQSLQETLESFRHGFHTQADKANLVSLEKR